MKKIIGLIIVCMAFIGCYKIEIEKKEYFNCSGMTNEFYYDGWVWDNGKIICHFSHNNKEEVERVINNFSETYKNSKNVGKTNLYIRNKPYQTYDCFYTNIPYCSISWTNNTDKQIETRAKILRVAWYGTELGFDKDDEKRKTNIKVCSVNSVRYNMHEEFFTYDEIKSVAEINETNSISIVTAKAILKQFVR